MRLMAGLILALGLLCGSPMTQASADIFSFRDENGVIHFSNVPMDTRYRFKMKETVRKVRITLYESRRKRYDTLIVRVARENDLDPHLLHAVVDVESRYDPYAVSVKGASGLMQIMPETAKNLGLKDVFHPEENLKAGAGYLRRLIDKYEGKIHLALAAYNAGEAAVDQYKRVPPYPETQSYVRKILGLYEKVKKKR